MHKFTFWSTALLLTLFSGGFTYVYLSSSFPDLVQRQVATTNTEMVVVAAKNITVRRSITESDLAVREVAFGTVPDGAVTSIEEITGMMATNNIFTNEIILKQEVAVAGAVIQEIALTIPDSKVLVSIPLQTQLISIGLVKPGDHVDLFGTFVAEEISRIKLDEAGFLLASAENIAETIAVLRKLEVHAIIIEPALAEAIPANNMPDDESGNELENESDAASNGVFQSKRQGEQSILVALDRQDSIVVKHLLDTVGQLDIALRTPDDNELTEVTNVDLFYLANRYGIEIVRADLPVMSEELFEANREEFILTGTEPSPEFLAAIDQK